MGKDPKKLVENSKNPTQKTSIRAAFRTSLALAFVMGFANVWGSHPKDNAKGGRAWYAVVLALDSDFFFRVKCDASHLVFFFSGCEGLPRDGKAKGQTRRTRRRGSGPRRGSARRGMFSIGFSFRVVVTQEAPWMGDGAHFCAHFFSSFSLLFWVDVEAVKNEMTDILVTLSLSQSSAAACAPTNTRSSVNTTS